jgi:hypothetical protein
MSRLTRSEAIKDYKHLRKVAKDILLSLEKGCRNALTEVSLKDMLSKTNKSMDSLKAMYNL